MLTQKERNPQPPPRKTRAELLIEGFIPSKEAQERFDIAPSYRTVVDYLGEKGFRVEGCADYDGQEMHGGGLSGIPWNSCQFDVYADVSEPAQAKLSTVLRMLTDTLGFRAQAVFRTYEEPSGKAGGPAMVCFSYENPDPEAALRFLRAAESAESIEVRYIFSGGRGSFVL